MPGLALPTARRLIPAAWQQSHKGRMEDPAINKAPTRTRHGNCRPARALPAHQLWSLSAQGGVECPPIIEDPGLQDRGLAAGEGPALPVGEREYKRPGPMGVIGMQLLRSHQGPWGLSACNSCTHTRARLPAECRACSCYKAPVGAALTSLQSASCVRATQFATHPTCLGSTRTMRSPGQPMPAAARPHRPAGSHGCSRTARWARCRGSPAHARHIGPTRPQGHHTARAERSVPRVCAAGSTAPAHASSPSRSARLGS